MFFNSLHFAVFLPIVFILYWFVCNKNKSWQNGLLIIASYYFYACWDWRFLFLLVFSTLLDYFSGIQIEKSKSVKESKFWFWLSIIVNLGFLGVFKYYNFFVTSFTELINGFGFQVNPLLINVILPVGISFYTFHGLSYVIDIYYKRIKAEYNFIDYSLFVSYFPLLVAGPIERATHLLPQVKVKRIFNYKLAIVGLNMILWGLFKKMVLADNCALLVNDIFSTYQDQNSLTLVLGGVLFAFQIYGDFSGYTDIALGTSKLFGINLLKNFNFPYFSRDIAEFWRRWHISLSSWFRDYLYIPLGGSKGGKWMQVRNTFIIFLVSGFWHGANWTFLAWGLLNALYFIPILLFDKNRTHLDTVASGKNWPSLKEFSSILITFSLTVIAWIFFRADTLEQAIGYIYRMTTSSWTSLPISIPTYLGVIICFFIVIEWKGRESDFVLETVFKRNRAFKWLFYYLLVFCILFLKGEEQQFIYFQF